MSQDPTKPVHQQVMVNDSNQLRMPSGTPLGLGILGAMRFSAIKRVLDHAANAALAKANYHEAEGAVAQSLVNREVARERLRNIDVIRQEAADQIIDGAYVARLRRQLEKIELEDRIAEREAARDRVRARQQQGEQKGGVARDEFADFMDGLRRMPDVAKAAASVKAQIIKDAGGEEKLDEGARQMVETIDSMMSAFVAKQAEGKMT